MGSIGRLLFLGASVSQLPAIRFAVAAGHYVVACDGDPGAPAFSVCRAEVVDFSDVDRVEAVARLHRVEGILAVCTDRAVVPAAEVAARLRLPGIGVDVARAMSHKPTMRARLAQGGIPQPRHVVLRTLDDLGADNAVGFPAVLKPADSGGQRGLFLIEHDDEIADRLPLTLAASRSGEAMLEEYVPGTELNALIAVRRGVPSLLTLSDRLRPEGPGFGVGWIHSFPSSLPPALLTQVGEVACAAVGCLGLRDGIAFPQLIASSRGVVVVEVAARIAAGQMADLVRHGTGIELFEIAIAQALGELVPDTIVAPRFTRPIAIRFLTASPGRLPVGKVAAIDGLERVRKSKGVIDADLYFDVGAEIAPVQVDADRKGYVIATAKTARTALARADAAGRKLRIGVESRPGARTSAGRTRRWLPAVTVAVLLVATVAAFGLTERAKLEKALVAGTRVDKTFSPVCGCPQKVAHIAFRLERGARVAVAVVSRSARLVATLIPLRYLSAGRVDATWSGRGRRGRLVLDGVYFPEVRFAAPRRTLVLPSSIVLDTDRPRVAAVHLRIGRSTIVVRYRFSEPARAVLLVDERRAVLTRFAPTRGYLRWPERFQDGRRLRPGRHRLALIAIDAAGNRSLPRALPSLDRL